LDNIGLEDPGQEAEAVIGRMAVYPVVAVGAAWQFYDQTQNQGVGYLRSGIVIGFQTAGSLSFGFWAV
jgi:hypothetical protein